MHEKQRNYANFLLFQPKTVIMIAQILPQLRWYVFAWWQLHLGCFAFSLLKVRRVPLTETIFVQQRGTQHHNWAELTCISREQFEWSVLDESGRFLFLLGISSGVILFLQRHPNNKYITVYIGYLSWEIIEFESNDHTWPF